MSTDHPSIALVRGHIEPDVVGPCHLIVYALPKEMSKEVKNTDIPSLIIAFDSSEHAHVCLHHKSKTIKPSFTKLDQGVLIALDQLALNLPPAHLRIDCKPWYEIVSPSDLWVNNQPQVYLPMMGWINQKWHCGPIYHLDQRGNVVGFIPDGDQTCLRVTFNEGSNDSIDKKPNLFETTFKKDLSEGLVASFRHYDFPSSNMVNIRVETFSPWEAIALCLLRRAHPKSSLNLIASKNPELWPPPWKRFSEHLGATKKQAHKNSKIAPSQDESFCLDPWKTMIETAGIESLTASINATSRMIPSAIFLKLLKQANDEKTNPKP